MATAVICLSPSGKVTDLPPNPFIEPQSGTTSYGWGKYDPIRGHPCKGMRERPPNFKRASFDKVTGLHRPTVILSKGYDTDCVSLLPRGGGKGEG